MATSIVAYWSPMEIVIAADSKRTRVFLKNGKEIVDKSDTCKIYQVKKVYLAGSGLVEDQQVGYNSKLLAVQAFSKGNDLLKEVIIFEELIKAQIPAAVNRHKQNNPESFKRKFEIDDRVIAQFIFAGQEKGELKLFGIDFMLAKTTDGTIKIISERTECPGCGSEKKILIAGRKESILQYLARNRLQTQDPIEIVRTFIQIEIAGDSDNVGPPIDIIRIDKSGSKWIQKKIMCP